MEPEILNQIITAITALLGVTLGFFANFLTNKIEHSRQIKRDKEEHLKELFNVLADNYTSSKKAIQNMMVLLLDIEDEKLSRRDNEDFNEVLNEYIAIYNSSLEEIEAVSAKFSFKRVLNIKNENDELNKILDAFLDIVEELRKKKESILITNKDAELIRSLSAKHDEYSEVIHVKMEEFYSARYLPKQ